MNSIIDSIGAYLPFCIVSTCSTYTSFNNNTNNGTEQAGRPLASCILWCRIVRKKKTDLRGKRNTEHWHFNERRRGRVLAKRCYRPKCVIILVINQASDRALQLRTQTVWLQGLSGGERQSSSDSKKKNSVEDGREWIRGHGNTDGYDGGREIQTEIFPPFYTAHSVNLQPSKRFRTYGICSEFRSRHSSASVVSPVIYVTIHHLIQ